MRLKATLLGGAGLMENFIDTKQILNKSFRADYLKVVEQSLFTTMTETANVDVRGVPGSGLRAQYFLGIITPHPHPLQGHGPHFLDEGTEIQQQ